MKRNWFLSITMLCALIYASTCSAISWSDVPASASPSPASIPATTHDQQQTQSYSADEWNSYGIHVFWSGGLGYSGFGGSLDASKNGATAYTYQGQRINYNEPVSVSPGFVAKSEIGMTLGKNLGTRMMFDYISLPGTAREVTLTAGNQSGKIPGASGSGSEFAYSIQAMGYMPLVNDFDIYGALGIGLISASVNVNQVDGMGVSGLVPANTFGGTAFAIPVSVGGDWKFSRYFAANIDLTYLISTSNNAASAFIPTANIKFTY